MIPALLALSGSLLVVVPLSTPPPDPGGDPTFVPEIVYDLPGGPSVAFLRAGTPELVALRLSLPLTEAPEEAGAGSLLRAMAEERMQALASRVGARVRAVRTPDALVYEAVGPEEDLDFLVWILGEGIRSPDPDRFEAFRRIALADVARRMETPQGVLALRLRQDLSPGAPPLLGTIPALERMDASRLSAVWARTHRRDAARVLVIGSLPAEVALASLSDLHLPDVGPDPAFPPSPPLPEARHRPEVIRHWTGSAWRVPGGHDPRALVATRLISEALGRRPGDYEAGVELWEVGGRWFLVLSGAAYPRGRQALRQRLDGLLQEVREGLSEEEVKRHAARTRMEFLDSAKTPWGLAEMVGQALDAGRDPGELERMLASLSSMGAQELRSFFDEVGSGTPIRHEVSP